MSDTPATDVETPVDATAETTTEQTPVQTQPTSPADAGQPSDATGDSEAALQTVEATDTTDPTDTSATGETGETGDKKSRVRQLEREGEVAADFLETLLDIADLDGDIDVDVDGDRAAIAIVDSDEGRVPRRLVGTDGKVLEALQELTRLAVQVETGERSRLMLDIAGHRAQRRSALVELAKVAIAEVQESGTKRSLEPMTAFERKVVHDEVSAAGLVSESEGVDPHRHIVILPA
jgi:spoIIIJ-associated protein